MISFSQIAKGGVFALTLCFLSVTPRTQSPTSDSPVQAPSNYAPSPIELKIIENEAKIKAEKDTIECLLR